MSDTEKSKLREGDSWRARVYRRKDEVLPFNFGRLQEHTTKAGNHQEVLSLFMALHEDLKALSENPDSETNGAAALNKLDGIHNLLVSTGFDFNATTEEKTV